MMLALIKDGAFISEHSEGSRIDLPGGAVVLNALSDWSGLGYSLHEIAPPQPVPAGKFVKSSKVELVAGIWTRVNILDSIPVPTKQELREQMPPITKRQLRLTLVRNGITISSIDALIDAMPDGIQKQEAEIEWNSETFERLYPTLVMIAGELDLTPDQVDALWEYALTV